MWAFDSAGSPLHYVRQVNVNDVVFPYPLNQVSYSGQDVGATLGAGEGGFQRFHTDLAETNFHFTTTTSGQFQMQTAGDSRVAIIAILTPQPPLLLGGDGPTPGPTRSPSASTAA
jgi:hypothetical protein